MPTEGIKIPGETFLAWEEPKDPGSAKDYQLDWSDWLGSDTINSSTWTIDSDAGVSITDTANTTTTTTAWFSTGGNAGRWPAVNTIVTAGGRTEQRTRLLIIEET